MPRTHNSSETKARHFAKKLHEVSGRMACLQAQGTLSEAEHKKLLSEIDNIISELVVHGVRAELPEDNGSLNCPHCGTLMSILPKKIRRCINCEMVIIPR